MNRDDKELIRDWQEKQDRAAYNELKNRHRRMVFMFVNRYKSSSVPQSALKAKGWSLFDDAVNNYDPDKGAKFSTYLHYQLRKLDRYAKKYQNVARIPETLAGKIGDYDKKFNEMKKKKGKAPSHKEMSNEMKIPQSHVKRLHKSRRQDLFQGIFEEKAQETGAVGPTQDDTEEKLDWMLIELRDELSPQEQRVYDHLIGHNTEKIRSKKKLAKKLNMSPGRVSQITKNISRKLKPHMQQRL